MVLKNTKPLKKGGHQSLRGRPREFSDPRELPDSDSSDTDGSSSTSGSESEVEELSEGMQKTALTSEASKHGEAAKGPIAGSKDKTPNKGDRPSPATGSGKPASTPGSGSSRREREAIEKEQARQYYLRMKEKEDAGRLALVRKQREEAAAKYAEEQRAKQRRP